MATQSLKKVTEKADRIKIVRDLITQEKEAFKKAIEPLEIEEEKLKKQLLNDLNFIGLTSIKTKTGDIYTRAVRYSVSVVNEIFAYRWAEENKATKIDLLLASQIIKEMAAAPPGFEKVETEYIKITKPEKKPDATR